ncbi:uncharacterized protein BDZ99DRAFT_47773 [Mytilinidion resinicola]|uniref:Uncharacterized protein n=1 Tax=Mytilinidion resinicola TaxID=574789 RepID=A0A6A6YMZ0_9PEZI|nr:uncharacterized protein BDZ99DRAFT_47773 [Mytilinidion resinicola]KAF2809237.1 hypothetical protein BDZ99DRAFT_47773 [Mytilinidion resinicola]
MFLRLVAAVPWAIGGRPWSASPHFVRQSGRRRFDGRMGGTCFWDLAPSVFGLLQLVSSLSSSPRSSWGAATCRVCLAAWETADRAANQCTMMQQCDK